MMTVLPFAVSNRATRQMRQCKKNCIPPGLRTMFYSNAYKGPSLNITILLLYVTILNVTILNYTIYTNTLPYYTILLYYSKTMLISITVIQTKNIKLINQISNSNGKLEAKSILIRIRKPTGRNSLTGSLILLLSGFPKKELERNTSPSKTKASGGATNHPL